ncbi:glycosyltransferase family 39 protein [Roseibium sp. MMSF_3544]|uniref:glycosyltransferase family 39 protein n=1 Tax=unclassified Roseibium TaxID=2629323 RepID=UPI00273DC196|nr:glycosyltransferase family 39 protein [Roseibium sp. MMSF_3544]
MRPADKQYISDLAASVLLLIILAVAAAIRFQDLARTSLWYDEAVSWSQSNGSFADLLASVAADNYPPLHNVVLWQTMPLIGDSETALRLPSALLGVLSVWLVYLIGRHLRDKTTGLLAAALLTFSPFHIWYSTEARMYALLAACGLAFLLAALKVLKKPSAIWVVLLALSGALFLYSHVYALFGFACVGSACAAFALKDVLDPEKRLRSSALVACLAMAASVVLFAPWLVILAGRARSVANEGFWIAFPDLTFLRTTAFTLSGSLVLFWVLVGLAVVGVVSTLLKRPHHGDNSVEARQSVVICVAYTLGPALLAYFYSILVQPILFDRYLIAAWPGLLLLAALGAGFGFPRLAPLALFGVALVLTYPQLKFTLTEKIRPEWREVAAYYLENREPNDRLVLYKGFAEPVLSYYLRGENQFEAVESVDAVPHLSYVPETGNTWLLLAHLSGRETDDARQASATESVPPAIQRFGWGASGLTLLKSGPAPK